MRKKNVFRVLRELKKRISEEQFDIIHCHGSRANLMGALLLRSMQIPVVSTIHSDYRLDYLGRPFGRLFYGTTNAIALRKLDYYIGVSDAMVDLLIRRKFPPDRLFAIYNGLDFSRPPRKADPETCRKSFGLEAEAGAVIVGIAARLSPVKDVGTLIRAFARAVARCPRLRLLIAGDGPELEKLKALAKRLGVSERVCFAGWVPDMDLFYQAIHINALTSLSETFPYALTEGARMSLPTVGSNVGGIPYLIEDGVTGFLFPPGDDALLAERLVALAEDEALRRKLGENLYEKASRDFSVERTGRRQIEIYETILRRSRRPAGRDGVIICGAYGRGNAGDESILEAILKQLRRIDPDLPIWVMSRRPEETRLRFRVNAVYTFSVLRWIPIMRGTRLYINGGGSLMQDITSSRSIWFYLFTIFKAHTLGNKVLMYGCGIGPIQRDFNRKLAARTLNAHVTCITLRDGHSQGELAEMGIDRPEIILSADPTVVLTPAPPETIDAMFSRWGLDPRGNYIGFSLRRWPGFQEKAHLFGRAADYAWEKYGLRPVFLPIENHSDISAAQAAAKHAAAPCFILPEIEGSARTIGAFSRMRVVVSMRLHGLVFAAGQGVPVVGVVYDPKVRSFLSLIGQEHFSDLKSLTLETLKHHIDLAVAESGDPGARNEAVRRLQALEGRNIEAVRRLLGP